MMNPRSISFDKLEAMKNTILFCANKCVASDRLDDWALKLFGHFAYDFRTNTQGLAFPSDLLATQLTYFQRMKANWLSLYMQGMIIETINPLQASSHYDQALDYLWEAYGAVPSPFDHSDALLIDVRKLEVFYRLTNTIRSMVDDGNSSIDATARLKKQLQRFEPNCSVRRWSKKMLIIRCFEICALINRSHKDAVYQLANIYLNSDGQCRDESVAERLLMGTYQTYSADTIPGLFAEQQPENFFHVKYNSIRVVSNKEIVSLIFTRIYRVSCRRSAMRSIVPAHLPDPHRIVSSCCCNISNKTVVT